MSVLLLARQGKLRLDDDVRKYLPELPDYQATITIRQLIHHTSGVQNTAWTPPTLAGAKLYLRDRKNLVALDLAAK